MSGHGADLSQASPLERGIERARGILPDQGPIGVFIHHNTLHAFQHLPFHEAVPQGAAWLGARPYLALSTFSQLHVEGRIAGSDVEAALSQVLGARAAERLSLGARRDEVWRALLLDSLDEEDAPGLAYLVEAGLRDGGDLLAAAEARLARTPRVVTQAIALHRHHDAILALGGDDTDAAVHAEMIRLGAVFLDHGQALAHMPRRDAGFLAAVAYLFDAGAPEPRGCPGVRNDILRAAASHRTALQLIDETLDALGVDEAAREAFIMHTALALPGWTGMFARLERHPEEHEGEGPVSLTEFLAVRLMHDRRAAELRTRGNGWPLAWSALRALAQRPAERAPLLDAWILAGVARRARVPAAALAEAPDAALVELWREVDACSGLMRQRVWQDAYEGTYRRQILDGVAGLRAEVTRRVPSRERPDAQYIFCIDEREESIRRALDEQPGHNQTFGAAGFFGVAIDYQGLDDRKPAAYCPVVVTPQHEVHEAAEYAERDWHAARAGLRARWQAASRGIHKRSRTLSGGAFLSFVVGPLAAMTAIARVIAPRSSLALRDRVSERLVRRPSTRLAMFRDPASENERSRRGKLVGFTLDEAADRVTALLRNVGLTDVMAPIVVVLGHGSTSLNNPHESAHDCGACGGRRGEANARLFAALANDPAVRAAVRARGVIIPLDTWFVGALHDTADDSVRYADLDLLPPTHTAHFDRASETLERARGEAASERVRRFDDAPLSLPPLEALRHVEARASHLGQPRPEYGHCTNAVAVVGRRELTRGLHMDRRAFLISYDPAGDTDDVILERILAAVGPVGAGINLEYYFSSVDNEVFGCGTKLPHNVTGLIGVMAGHQSDLRTGLPLQMVELHEPMRLLLIVEATPASLLTVAGRQAEVRELVVNEWVQLVSVDPDTGAMHVFANGTFVPYTPGAEPVPRVQRSAEWHGQARQHLPPAIVLGAIGSPSEVRQARDPRTLPTVA